MGAKRTARVLVVDDEANIRRLLKAILARLPGFDVTVTEAENAEDAVRLMEKHRFHLIITDYRMSGRSGVDLLAFAHQASPATGRMLITAFGELDIGVEAINRGRVDGFMRKPWEHANLVALVESLLDARVGGASVSVGASGGPTPHASPAPATPNRPPAAPPASAAASAPAARAGKDKDAILDELAAIDRHIRQLRVRLGLGNISPEGYQRANSELTARKADLEVTLMKMDA